MDQLQVRDRSTQSTDTNRSAVHPGWLVTDRCVAERPAPGDESEAILFSAFAQLMRTAGALDRAASETLADLGLTAGAFFALLELADAEPNGLAPSELARKLAVARRTATLYVDILARQGWVARSPHPDDRRMVLAQLTDAGQRLVCELSGAYKRRLGQLVEALTPIQAERLRQLLAAVPLTTDAAIELGTRDVIAAPVSNGLSSAGSRSIESERYNRSAR